MYPDHVLSKGLSLLIKLQARYKWTGANLLFSIKRKKTNPRISHASSCRLTKIWTVRFMFLLWRLKMPELNPGEGPQWVEGLQAEGHSCSVTISTRFCPCSWFASMLQIRKWTNEVAQGLEVWSSPQMFSVLACLFCGLFVGLVFFPTGSSSKQ